MKKKSNNLGIRALMSGKVVELWLGEPGNPESDCLAHFHSDFLPGIMEQLNNLHKVPKKPANSMNYGVRNINSNCLRDARKALGKKPYDGGGNYLVGDGYFSRDCANKYGDKQWQAALDLVRGE